MAYVVSSGVTRTNIILSSNYMNVYSGGVAENTTVDKYGSMFVYSGGTANETNVKSFGILYISSGGTANNIVWTPCEGHVSVYDGGYEKTTSYSLSGLI